MKAGSSFIVVASIIVAGCSMGKLERIDGSAVHDLGYGKVLDGAAIEVDSDESLAERAVVGTVSGGLIVGASAALAEPGVGTQMVYRYIIKRPDGSHETLLSRSLIETKSCVSITIREGHDFPILRGADGANCLN